MVTLILPVRARILAAALAFGSCVLLRCTDAFCAVNAPNGARQPDDLEDGQWLRAAKNFASTRFSQLDQIRTANVKELKVAWTFSTGIDRGHEAAPIVAGSTLYVVTPFPNVLYALDLNNSGAVKWKYEAKAAPAAQGVACCDVVNRGAVMARNSYSERSGFTAKFAWGTSPTEPAAR